MTRDVCRYPSCDNGPGEQDRDDYDARRFCSVPCQLKYEHVRADARDARREERSPRRGELPERDHPCHRSDV